MESNIFVIRRIGSVAYLGIRKSAGRWHFVSERGENFGAWMSPEGFIKAMKETRPGELKAAPLGQCGLAVQVL